MKHELELLFLFFDHFHGSFVLGLEVFDLGGLGVNLLGDGLAVIELLDLLRELFIELLVFLDGLLDGVH